MNPTILSRSAVVETPKSAAEILLVVKSVMLPLTTVLIVRSAGDFCESLSPASQSSAELSGIPLASTGTSPSAPRWYALRYPRQNGFDGLDWKAARKALVLPVVLVVGTTGVAKENVAAMIWRMAC